MSEPKTETMSMFAKGMGAFSFMINAAGDGFQTREIRCVSLEVIFARVVALLMITTTECGEQTTALGAAARRWTSFGAPLRCKLRLLEDELVEAVRLSRVTSNQPSTVKF